jgi:hypothetical protein
MPRLVKLFIVNGLIGLALGAAFTGLLLWLNVANLGHLVLTSPVGWLAALMLVAFSGITFGGVQIGIVVMNMAEKDDRGDGGKRRPEPVAEPALLAVPVESGATRRR